LKEDLDVMNPKVSIAAILVVANLACAQMDRADQVYRDGRIYTGNEKAPWAEAVAIKDDQIIYVGSAAGVSEAIGRRTKIYDLEGRLALPGLVDAHTHPGWVALTSQHLQLAEASTQETLVAAIADMLAENPKRDTVIAMAWENDVFGPQGPDKTLLDAIENKRPVLLWDSWMHSLWVNSKALEIAGANRNTNDPVPGFSYYGRDADGELTGYITESAATEFWNSFETLNDQSRAELLAFIQHLSRSGVTALYDAGNFGVDRAVLDAVEGFEKEGKLPLRYFGTYTLYLPKDLDGAIDKLKALQRDFSTDLITVDTMKVFLDGVIETRTAHLTRDYADTPGNSGQALLSRRQVRDLVLEMDKEELNLHFHTVGNQSAKTVLDAVESARQRLGRLPRIRIALSHLEVLDAVDVMRFASLGVTAQFTPWWHGGYEHEEDSPIGDWQDTMFLTRRMAESGANFSFSSDVYFKSDWDSGNANPFLGIETGHTRQFVGEGKDAPVAKPVAEAMTVKQMVDGYTRGGAYQMGAEGEIGTLEVGKKADFIVLDANVFELDPHAIHEVRPTLVIMDGDRVSAR
jgi:predicted amidohydrolase YtcJ